MRRIAAGCTATTLLLMAPACAAPPAAGKAPNCRPPACEVTIVVPSTCGSGIAVSPDPIVVRAAAGALEIRWTIATPGWTFGEPGIFVHGATEAQFGPGRERAPGRFSLANKARPGTYKYDINLVDAHGKPCQLDPTIMNW